MLKAKDKEGNDVLSWDLIDKSKAFLCPHCGESLIFVDALVKIKHFRHKTGSDCAVYGGEPETEEHISCKKLVYDCIKYLNFGKPYLEHDIGDKAFEADVFWERPGNCPIAFEIQASNYSFKYFKEKIDAYSLRDFVTVYYFIGDNFFHKARKNIYQLKEIEKQLLYSNTFKDSALGFYLWKEGGEYKIVSPALKPKSRRGEYGLCSNLFINNWHGTQQMSLYNHLKDLSSYYPKGKYKPEHKKPLACKEANNYLFKLRGNKQIRWGRWCRICSEFVDWIAEKDYPKYGLEYPIKKEVK